MASTIQSDTRSCHRHFDSHRSDVPGRNIYPRPYRTDEHRLAAASPAPGPAAKNKFFAAAALRIFVSAQPDSDRSRGGVPGRNAVDSPKAVRTHSNESVA